MWFLRDDLRAQKIIFGYKLRQYIQVCLKVFILDSNFFMKGSVMATVVLVSESTKPRL